MDIRIRQLSTTYGPRWQVCLDQHGVSFRSEREALDFVATLENRLRAPHPLPWRDSALTRNAS